MFKEIAFWWVFASGIISILLVAKLIVDDFDYDLGSTIETISATIAIAIVAALAMPLFTAGALLASIANSRPVSSAYKYTLKNSRIIQFLYSFKLSRARENLRPDVCRMILSKFNIKSARLKRVLEECADVKGQ